MYRERDSFLGRQVDAKFSPQDEICRPLMGILRNLLPDAVSLAEAGLTGIDIIYM